MWKYPTIALASVNITAKSDVLVRVESEKSHFLVFKEHDKLLQYIVDHQNVAIHEITRLSEHAHRPNLRLFFDVDCERELWGNFDGHVIEERLVKSISSAVSEMFGEEVAATKFVAKSSDYINKVSVHIIFPDIIFNRINPLRRAAVKIAGKVEPWITRSIDLLYKKNCGLRMLYSTKFETTRRKIPAFADVSADVSAPSLELLLLSCIQDYNGVCTLEPWDEKFPVEETQVTGVADEAWTEHAMELVAKLEGGTHFRPGRIEVKNGFQRFNLMRTVTSFCHVCSREHSKDHSYVDNREGTLRFGCYPSMRDHVKGTRTKKIILERATVVVVEKVNVVAETIAAPVAKCLEIDDDLDDSDDSPIKFKLDTDDGDLGELEDSIEYSSCVKFNTEVDIDSISDDSYEEALQFTY